MNTEVLNAVCSTLMCVLNTEPLLLFGSQREEPDKPFPSKKRQRAICRTLCDWSGCSVCSRWLVAYLCVLGWCFLQQLVSVFNSGVLWLVSCHSTWALSTWKTTQPCVCSCGNSVILSMLAVRLSAHLLLVAVDGFMDMVLSYLICTDRVYKMLLPPSGFTLSLKMQQLPCKPWEKHLEKHIDLTKLVSWKHLLLKYPLEIIATKFLLSVRRTTET